MRSLTLCLVVSGILSMSACDSAKKATHAGANAESKTVAASAEIRGKKWQLVELSGKPVPDSINGKVPFIEFQKDSDRYEGSAGCNGVGGTYSLPGNNRINFALGMSTMMYCNNMAFETGLKEVLQKADNYSISGNQLSLNKARMAPLARFIALPSDYTANLEGNWELKYISGPRIAFDGLFPDKKPTLQFNLSEKKAFGNSSCNNYNTTVMITGNRIQFGMPMSTKMACPGSGETSFFSVLQKINGYSIADNVLTLLTGDIAMMRFEKTNP